MRSCPGFDLGKVYERVLAAISGLGADGALARVEAEIAMARSPAC